MPSVVAGANDYRDAVQAPQFMFGDLARDRDETLTDFCGGASNQGDRLFASQRQLDNRLGALVEALREQQVLEADGDAHATHVAGRRRPARQRQAARGFDHFPDRRRSGQLLAGDELVTGVERVEQPQAYRIHP